MKSFMEILSENIARFPGRVGLRSATTNRGVSYGELDEYSGKVYAYLKQKGIGKEDMVLICMPRGTRAIVSMIGVWKAGAALTIVEDTYAPERIEFILKDCNCKLVLNADVYEEMMQVEPLSGFEKTDSHDAAFAVYTSGTTGNPKGVLHEYGKLSQISYSQKSDIFGISPEGSILAIFIPLNFVASIINVLRAFTLGNCICILPYDFVKNTAKYAKFLLDEKVAETFMPPSFFKIYKDVSPYLCNIFVGGESCNGVFLDGPCIVNTYASSEAGMVIAAFIVDKIYERTPVGKNGFGLEYLILDDNGNRLPDGEIGEICFFNEFTRGYINLPDKTKEVFVDGIYHMGDLGYINENGYLMVCGRKDDMIKINGNRIEPVEIECAICENLDIKNVVVKGFNEDDRSFICAYFIEKELEEKGLLKKGELRLTSEEMKERLQKRLPYYMIPTYYVVMDTFPLNANGKIDRKNIKAPDADDFVENYEAATTETEKYLCELFARVLKKKRVGVNDDFYLIGGDSLSSMALISECKLHGISVNELYHLRTPKKMAAYYDEAVSGEDEDIDEKNRKALEYPQILLSEMVDVLDYSFIMPSSTMWNLPLLLQLVDGIDVSRFAMAVNRVLCHHPSFQTVIYFDEDTVLKQKYVPEQYEPIAITELTEEEFEKQCKNIVKPFKLLNSTLHRKGLFVTEKATYFYFEPHHLITDGTSIGIILQQIMDCYADVNKELEIDYYYLMLHEYEKCITGDSLLPVKQNYKEKFERLTATGDYSILPQIDKQSNRWEIGFNEYVLPISKKIFKQNLIAKEVGGNTFFAAACLLAIGCYNRTSNSALQWIYNGRDNATTINTSGLLYKALPLFSILTKDISVEEYLFEIREQINYSMANNQLPTSGALGLALEDTVFFLYQKNILDFEKYDLVKRQINLDNPDNAADSYMEFSVIDNDSLEEFLCSIRYSDSHFYKSSVDTFFEIFQEIVSQLLEDPNPKETKIQQLISANQYYKSEK